MKTVYRCSDTITGVFSAIYDVWKSKEEGGVQLRGDSELELFCQYQDCAESNQKALALESMIKRHLGYAAYQDIYYAVQSFDMQKGNAILGTLEAARGIPDSRKIMDHISHPMVYKVFALSRNVAGEAHRMIEFIRFKELYNQVLYAEITPQNQVLTSVAPHFADRFPLENWMIYDKTHHMFVVHEKKKQWILVDDENFDMERALQVSDREAEFSALWKTFVATVSIESRENRRCQMNHLPLKYRPNMTEWQQ